MKKWIVGIDIGGTKISIVLAKPSGKIVSSARVKTRLKKQVPQNLKELSFTLKKLLSEKHILSRQLLGIGICAPGPVDPSRDYIPASPNMPGWEGVKIKKIIGRNFQAPVLINNDANAAALAVHYFGEGKKVANLIYVTVSTGIGSGVILNRQLVHGASFSAGELGHTTLIVNGPLCGCGKRGCLEAISSGTAIAKLANAAIRSDIKALKTWNFSWKKSFAKSILKRVQKQKRQVTSKEVKECAQKGDALSKAILNHAGFHLGVGLSNTINFLNPELVALGGGVLIDGERILKSARVALRRETWPISRKACRIVRTSLGQQVNDLGAVALVVNHLKRRS